MVFQQVVHMSRPTCYWKYLQHYNRVDNAAFLSTVITQDSFPQIPPNLNASRHLSTVAKSPRGPDRRLGFLEMEIHGMDGMGVKLFLFGGLTSSFSFQKRSLLFSRPNAQPKTFFSPNQIINKESKTQKPFYLLATKTNEEVFFCCPPPMRSVERLRATPSGA